MGIMQTKTELTLEQTQQGVSYEVLHKAIKRVLRMKRKVKELKVKKKEALLTLRQKPKVKSVNQEAITSLLSSINHVSNGESTKRHGFCTKHTHTTSISCHINDDELGHSAVSVIQSNGLQAPPMIGNEWQRVED
ncbi:hypothetical protein Tco_0149077 [Tanacetum coccineum]